MRTGRHLALLAAAALSTVLGVASLAWACTPQVAINPLTVRSGPSGTRFTVTGAASQPGVVQLRWNGVKGPVLGTAMATGGVHGTEYAMEVVVPDAAPGIYSVIAVQEAREATTGIGRAVFRVTPAPGSKPAGQAPADASAVSARDLWAQPSARQSESRAASTPGLATGMALLAVGLVTTLAGFGAIAVRRTRTRAQS